MTLNSASLIVLFFVVFSFMLGVIVKNIEQINTCREKRREKQKVVVNEQVVSAPVSIPQQVVTPVQVSVPQQNVVVPVQVNIPQQPIVQETVKEQTSNIVEDKKEDYDVPVIIRSIALSR